MSDRRLVVTEADSASADYGKMFALSPNAATGVAIPAFRIGTSRPTVGTTNGEGFYDSTTRQGYVWDGATWKDIAANPILQFATDADLQRDTVAAVGSYAISSTTGNLYVKRPAGWSRVGVALYDTITDLLSDSPTVGTLGEALDEGSLWERATGGWRITGPRGLPNTAAVLAWAAQREVHTFTVTTPAAAVGTEVVGATFDGTVVTVTATAAATPAAVAGALAAALLAGLPATFKVDYTPGQTTIVVRGPATGAPVVVTALQNMTDAVTAGNTATAVGANVGDTAVAVDVDVAYMRTPSGWRPVTIWEDTEANIRAATWALNGQEAIASDTGRTFARIQGTWIEEPIQHYATETLLLAATPPNGTLAWSDDTQVVFTRAGGTWHRMGSPTMTYGTTAPATPATGDLWYDSTGNRQTLNIWNGTAWISTTGVTHGATGARLVIPGYFAEDPSATATADDIGGLAFRYYGGQTQLWLNKDAAWHPVTPMLGVAANAGKVTVANAQGDMAWADPAVRVYRNVSSFDHIADNRRYEIDGTSWLHANGYVGIRFGSSTAWHTPSESDWTIWCREFDLGGSWRNPTVGQGYSISGEWIYLGSHWFARDRHSHVSIVIDSTSGPKNQRPPIVIEWHAVWDTGAQCQGRIQFAPTAGLSIDRVDINSTQNAEHHYTVKEFGAFPN